MTLEEEETLLLEEQSLLSEQASLTSQSGFMPEADRSPIPLDEAGIEQDDIAQLQSVDARELAQLQGKSYTAPDPGDSFMDQTMAVSNVFSQMSSGAINPIREFFGFEKRQPGTYINPVEQWQASETERKLSLAERGIRSGDLDIKSRFVEGLAMDAPNQVKAVKKNLVKRFGADVKVGVDKETNEPVYINPNDGKMYTTNPIGFDYGDVAGFVGDAITMSFETAGIVTGSVLSKKKKATKSLTGTEYSKSRRNQEIGYGAAGAAIGDAVKISLGTAFDINDDVTIGEIALDAAKEAAVSIGFGVAFESTKALIKKIRSVRGEAVIPGHILDSFKDKVDNINDKNLGTQIGNNEFVDAINETLVEAQSDQVLRPNIAQLLNDSDTLDIVESLKKTGAPERKPIIQREGQNLAAQKEYFTLISKQVTDAPAVGPYQLGQDIQSVTNKSLNAEIVEAESKTLASVATSKELTQGLPMTTPYKAGEAVKEAIFEEEAIFKGTANKEYRMLEQRALELNLIPETFNMKLKLVSIDSGETSVKKDRVSDLFEVDDLDMNTEWSLSKINNSIKDLRAKLKAYGSGKSDVQKGSILKAIDILKETKRQALKNDPDLLMRMDALDKVYSEGMEIFNDGISKAIIDEKKPMAASEIFKSVIKNSATAKNVGMAIMDRPEARLQMQKGIHELYRTNVVENGIVNLGKHKKFIREYVDSKIITPFYSKQQLRGIKRAGAIGRVYNIEKKRSDVLIEKLNKSFKTKISVLDGKTLFNRVWGSESQGNIITLRKELQDHPKLWASVQAQMLDKIQKKIMSNNTFSMRSFETLLNDNSGTIKEGLGEGYLKNLTMLKESLDVTARKGKAYDVNEKSLWAYIGSIALGPLNPTTRKINAADKIRSTYARKLISEMVLEPEKLRKLSALRRTRRNSDTAQLILSQMGFGILIDGGDNDFRSALKEVGYTAGLMTKRQKQLDMQREKEQSIKEEKERKDRIQFLQSRQKTLSQFQ